MTKICTPFCHRNCKRKHHPVLLALIDATCEESFARFVFKLRAFQFSVFDLTRPIPDPELKIMLPLLHWATVLGNIKAVKLLLNFPYKSNPQMKNDQGENALHMLLKPAVKASLELSVIEELIEIFTDCLNEFDFDKQTPLHVCAKILSVGPRRVLKSGKGIFNKMLSIIEYDEQLINRQNSLGETILHLLAKRNELSSEVEFAVCCGADLEKKDSSGKTPIAVAWKYSIVNYNLLNALSQSKNCELKSRIVEAPDYKKFFDANNDEEQEQSRQSKKRKQCNVQRKEKMGATSISQEHTGRPQKRKRVVFYDNNSDEEYKENSFHAIKAVTQSENSTKEEKTCADKQQSFQQQNKQQILQQQEINTPQEQQIQPPTVHPRFRMYQRHNLKPTTNHDLRRLKSVLDEVGIDVDFPTSAAGNGSVREAAEISIRETVADILEIAGGEAEEIVNDKVEVNFEVSDYDEIIEERTTNDEKMAILEGLLFNEVLTM